MATGQCKTKAALSYRNRVMLRPSKEADCFGHLPFIPFKGERKSPMAIGPDLDDRLIEFPGAGGSE
ncbi:MAG: hypothetical protein ABI357_08845 [Granulicella sp.]